VAVDSAGNIFFTEIFGPNRVRKITPEGIVASVAGGTGTGSSGDGGSATAASLYNPYGVAVDSGGNIFIADTGNNRIRKVTPQGIISTFAGTGVAGFSGDGGPATSAAFDSPRGLAVDSTGNLLIADVYNNRIRKVTPAGIITTVAGGAGFSLTTSGDGGAATSAYLSLPTAVATDSAGNLYIAETYNYRVRKVAPNGIISTIAGNGLSRSNSLQGFGGDGGPATSAVFDTPSGIAVDSAGTVYIADTMNQRIRRISTDGTITTIAGTGTATFGGDDGSAAAAQLRQPTGLVVDASGNLLVADMLNQRIRKITFAQPGAFSISDRGGSLSSSSGTAASLTTGYAALQPESGRTTPMGLAIFGLRQNNVLVSEATVPAIDLLQNGRIYAEIGGSVTTGLAIANPGSQAATIDFTFRDVAGNIVRTGSTSLAARNQIAKFLDQDPFLSGTFTQGTFSFTSTTPVSVVALRGFNNERTPSEFLVTTLPVVDVSAIAATGTQVVPHFAVGQGWATQLLLVNPSSNTQTGSIEFRNASGQAISVNISGQPTQSSSYSVAPASSQSILIGASSSALDSGSVRIVPSGGGTAPVPLIVFSYRPGAITVAEAGVPVAMGASFRTYVETSSTPPIFSGVAVANATDTAGTITLSLSGLDGVVTTTSTPIALPAGGQVRGFLSDFFPTLTGAFQGVLRVTSDVSRISVVALRARTNERGDFLITTTQPSEENALPVSTPRYFAHIVDSGGYTTQFILFSGRSGETTSGNLSLMSPSGSTLNWSMR
jgi:hypothetical protein